MIAFCKLMLIWLNSDSDCISSLTWNSGSQSSYLVWYCLSAVAGQWSFPLSLFSVFWFLFLVCVACFILSVAGQWSHSAGANMRLRHNQCLRFGDNLSWVLARPSCPTIDLSPQHRLLSRFIISNWPYRVASMSPINDKCYKWIETITSWDID